MSSPNEDNKSMSNLFKRAIYCSLSREKNNMIIELQKMFLENEDRLSKQIIANNDKQQFLNEYISRYNDLRKDLDIASTKRKTYDLLIQRSESANLAHLTQKIMENESIISKYGVLCNPHTINRLSKSKESSFVQFMRIIELNFQRFEESVYALQKRSFIIEQNQEFNVIVSQEFGSLTGLVDNYQRLNKENILLKQKEMEISGDVFSKRRNLKELPLQTIREIILFYQNELMTIERIQRLSSKPETKNILKKNMTLGKSFNSILCNILDFDDFCRDINFSMKPNPPRSPNAEKSLTHSSLNFSELSIEDARTSIQFDCQVAQEDMKKLTLSLNEFWMQDVQIEENPVNTLARLETIKTQLLNKIRDAQIQLEHKNKENSKLYDQLHSMSNEKSYFSLEYHQMYQPYSRLHHSHCQLTKLFYQNDSISKSIFAISSSFGTDLFENFSGRYQLIRDFLSGSVTKMVPPFNHKNSSSDPSPRDALPKMMATRKIIRPIASVALFVNRSKTKLTQDTIIKKSYSMSKSNDFFAIKPNYNPLDKFFRFSTLLKTAQCGGCLNPKNDYLWRNTHRIRQDILNSIINHVHTTINHTSYNQSMVFARIRAINATVLLKEKADKAIQVEFSHKEDSESQYNQTDIKPKKK